MSVQGPRAEDRRDEDLIRLFAQTGDPDRFAELFRRHRRRVFLACYGFFQDTVAAEDCAQETFVRVFENADRFREGDFVGWVLRIARNVCIDHWRRKRPESSLEGQERELPVPTGTSGVGGGVHLTLMQLRKEIQALPPQQQSCLELKIEGYSYEETAAATGLTAEAVRSHLQNARRTLRLRMKDMLAEIA
jgi:RNA polymerase sigma-70 factor (ECF subfamily)